MSKVVFDDEVPQRKSRVVFDDEPTDYKKVIGSAIKDSFQRPAAFAKDLGTNPVTMANAMPPLMGTVGGLSPLPGGATLGTGLGQGIRDVTLKAFNKPVPSMLQHGLELGGAAIGDVAAIPQMKGKYFGSQIGNAERAAGVVTRAPTKAVTPGSVGETLNTLEQQIDAGQINTPQLAKDAKAVVSQIYKNPKIYEQTGEIKVQSARVSQKVQDLLNKMIPGRSGPAQALGKAMTIPNSISRGWNSIPWPLKRLIQASPGIIGLEEIYSILRRRG